MGSLLKRNQANFDFGGEFDFDVECQQSLSLRVTYSDRKVVRDIQIGLWTISCTFVSKSLPLMHPAGRFLTPRHPLTTSAQRQLQGNWCGDLPYGDGEVTTGVFELTRHLGRRLRTLPWSR